MNIEQLLDGLELVCEVTEPSSPKFRDYSYLSQYFWGKPDFGSYVPHTFVFYMPYTNDDVPVYLFYRRSTNSKYAKWRQYRINRELSDSLRTRLHQVCSYHFSEDEHKLRPPIDKRYWWNLMPFIAYMQKISDKSGISFFEEEEGDDSFYSIARWLKEPSNRLALIVVQDSHGRSSLEKLGGFFTSYDMAYSWYHSTFDGARDPDVVWTWDASQLNDVGDELGNRMLKPISSSTEWSLLWEEKFARSIIIERSILSDYQVPNLIEQAIVDRNEDKIAERQAEEESERLADAYFSRTSYQSLDDFSSTYSSDTHRVMGFEIPETYRTLQEYLTDVFLIGSGVTIIKEGTLRINLFYYVKSIVLEESSIPLKAWYIIEYFVHRLARQLDTFDLGNEVTISQNSDCFIKLEFQNQRTLEIMVRGDSCLFKTDLQQLVVHDLTAINQAFLQTVFRG